METAKVEFRFKATTKKDEAGNVVLGEDKKPVKIPAEAPVTVEILQFKSPEDIQAILDKGDPKELGLLFEAVNEVINAQAKVKVDEDVAAARERGIPADLLTWEAIANMPPATRKGSGIPDETWDAFMEDYVQVMIHHGKTEDKAKMGAKFLKRKFAQVAGNKKVIEGLQKNLLVWFANTEQAEEFAKIYENLMSKADTLLAADEDVMVAAI